VVGEEFAERGVAGQAGFAGELGGAGSRAGHETGDGTFEGFEIAQKTTGDATGADEGNDGQRHKNGASGFLLER